MKVRVSEYELEPSRQKVKSLSGSFCGDTLMKNSLVARVRGLLVSDSEGSALVEMALLLPMMMLLITGTPYRSLVGRGLKNAVITVERKTP
jgi:hypothetical protein